MKVFPAARGQRGSYYCETTNSPALLSRKITRPGAASQASTRALMPARNLLGTRLEVLEDRSVPAAAFGVPWVDPEHLTLSFAPDGTLTPSGEPSVLTRVMSDAGTPDAWKREILRAFQSWAAHSNVNIGIVADGGQPLGAPGAVQGDSRFGDVRVTAAPEGEEMIAASSPFSYVGTTFSGDLLLNSTVPFRVGPRAGAVDLFSVALHEAGHILGLAHSDDATSVMYATYRSHLAPSAGDLATLRGMYGARVDDAYDAAARNDTPRQATTLPRVKGTINQYTAAGDVTTTDDVDVYQVEAPRLGLFGMSVRLRAEGHSLLVPRVTVLNKYGQEVALAVTTDPLSNDLSLRLPFVVPGATYYVKVEGATNDEFAIGSYQVVADFLAPLTTLPVVSGLLSPLVDGHTNDAIQSATTLLTTQGDTPDARFDYVSRGVIENASDVDTYRIVAPTTPGSGQMNLNALVWGTDSLYPRLNLFDAAGNPSAFEVLSNEGGVMSVQWVGATPGAVYYLQVDSRTDRGAEATGEYVVAADFNRLIPVRLAGLGSTTLNAGESKTGSLTVRDAGVFEFGLVAKSLGGAGGGVTMYVLDDAGNVVFRLSANAGETMVTRTQYLAAGVYRVRYDYANVGSLSPPIRADLLILKLSDQVGPYETWTSEPPPPPDEDDWTWNTPEEGYSYGYSSDTPSDEPYSF